MRKTVNHIKQSEAHFDGAYSSAKLIATSSIGHGRSNDMTSKITLTYRSTILDDTTLIQEQYFQILYDVKPFH